MSMDKMKSQSNKTHSFEEVIDSKIVEKNKESRQEALKEMFNGQNLIESKEEDEDNSKE